jgi:hypothetical protein
MRGDFSPMLADIEVTNIENTKTFDDKFIRDISDICQELDDIGLDVTIRFVKYCKDYNKPILSCCVDIQSVNSKTIDSDLLKIVIEGIQSYVSETGLKVDIELHNDIFVSVEEFLKNYNEYLSAISILIY